jgi:hypothetical protein
VQTYASGFLLLYTSIDILASLTRPENTEATDSTFFKGWVASYMLPKLGVPLSADDLWGAPVWFTAHGHRQVRHASQSLSGALRLREFHNRALFRLSRVSAMIFQ